MGQHRLAADKREPYETDIRIPFFAAGPGIAAGRTLPQVAGMVDLPPTILALAGVSPPYKYMYELLSRQTPGSAPKVIVLSSKRSLFTK